MGGEGRGMSGIQDSGIDVQQYRTVFTSIERDCYGLLSKDVDDRLNEDEGFVYKLA